MGWHMKYLLAILTCWLGAMAAQPEFINGQAVVVNNAVITYEEVESSILEEIGLLRRQYARQPQVLQQVIDQLRRDRLEMMIERQLILHEYKVKGYNLPDSLFDKALRDRIREQFGDRIKLTKTLQAQGTTYETYAQRYREQIIVELMTREFVSSEKILVSPFKIERFYEENKDDFKLEDQVRMRLIFLPQSAGMEAGAARKLAQEILAKIKEGTSFAEMAAIYSADANRAQGGARGWERRSALREDLATTAFALQAGQVSDILERPEGCYLLQVEEIKLAHIQPLAEVKEDIERRLKAEEYNRLRKKWIGRLRANSFVRYF